MPAAQPLDPNCIVGLKHRELCVMVSAFIAQVSAAFDHAAAFRSGLALDDRRLHRLGMHCSLGQPQDLC